MAEILHHLGWCWNPINNGINYQPQLVSRISAINGMSIRRIQWNFKELTNQWVIQQNPRLGIIDAMARKRWRLASNTWRNTPRTHGKIKVLSSRPKNMGEISPKKPLKTQGFGFPWFLWFSSQNDQKPAKRRCFTIGLDRNPLRMRLIKL